MYGCRPILTLCWWVRLACWHHHLHGLHSSVHADETSCDDFDNCTTTENNTTPLPGPTTAPPDTTSVGAAAIAAVLGVILLVLLVVCIVVLVVWLMRRRKRTKRDVTGNVCKHILHTYVIVSQRVYNNVYVYLSLSIAFVCVSPNSYTLWRTIWDLFVVL